MAENDRSAVDAATIMGLREDSSLLRELRDLFSGEATEQLGKMLEGCRGGDVNAVALGAHRLKGSAGTFGAEEMQRLCIEIEATARRGILEGVESAIQQLSIECDRVKRALDEAVDHPA